MPETEHFRIYLRYVGPDVANGTIPVDDLLSSLQGFAAAFRKLSRAHGLKYNRLLLEAPRAGSFVLVLGLIAPEQMSAVASVVSAAMATVAAITGVVVGLRSRHPEAPSEDARQIEGALVKILAPLRESHLTSIEVRAEYQGQAVVQELVPADKRALKDRRRGAAETDRLPTVRESGELMEALRAGSPEVLFLGTINSLNKTTNTGELVLEDGTRIQCRLVGRHPQRLYQFFAAPGPLRITGLPQFTNGSLHRIDILDIAS